jgi:hypothetical protein
VVTQPSPAPATAPSTSTGNASFLALELRPDRESAINFIKASLTYTDQCVIEPALPLLDALKVFGSGSEMFRDLVHDQVSRARGPSVHCQAETRIVNWRKPEMSPM